MLITAAALWGVARLNQRVAASVRQYETLRQLYDIGIELARADQARRGGDPPEVAWQRLLVAAMFAQRIDDAELSRRLVQRIQAGLSGDLGPALNALSGAVAATKRQIRQLDASAGRQRRATLIALALLSAATLTVAGLLARRQLASLEDRVRQSSAELARAERLASVGFLAAGVAHEINNPLGVISGEAEMALRQLQRDGDGPARALAQPLAVIRDEAFRCKAVTDRLLALAQAGPPAARPVDLLQLTRDAVAAVRRIEPLAQRSIQIHGSAAAVFAEPTLLMQVMTNLLVNALEAGDGPVQCRIEPGRWSVTDHGRGLDATQRQRVFEPFFTTKSGAGRGVGLGLSISHALVGRMGGRISVASEGPGRGATFTVELPPA